MSCVTHASWLLLSLFRKYGMIDGKAHKNFYWWTSSDKPFRRSSYGRMVVMVLRNVFIFFTLIWLITNQC